MKTKKTDPAVSPKPEYPTIAAKSAALWERWLEKNHVKAAGVWLRFFKKDSGVKSVYYAEALDVALCYGWIDGQAKPFDEKSYIQKFTPRRAKSIWSKRNTQHVERLIKSGRMRDAGHAAIEAAKKDGRWHAAYDSQRNTKMPADFLERLSRVKRAEAFFATLNRTNRYSIAWRLQTAKRPETRERRMEMILKMLSNGEKFH